jgi:hypothetical protein
MAQPVLLLDDGELDDVQQILEEIRAPYARVRGGAIVRNTPPPSSLLISTPRRIEMVSGAKVRAPGDDGPVRIVVVDGDSTTLRARLREIGFDYIVRRPVHPEALRLLLLHCLYSGEERRREPRVAAGFEVSFRAGLLPRRATLVEISAGGCRLQSSYRLETGKSIRIQIPKAAGASEALSLAGRVLRVDYDAGVGDEPVFCAAVAFEEVAGEARRELEWILAERAQGPATLAPPDSGDELEVDAAESAAAAPVAPGPVEPATAPPAGVAVDVRMQSAGGKGAAEQDPSGHSRERRRHPRAHYGRKVPAFGTQALRVLLGRDLSARGMRVERFPELEIGDRLHLALYGDPHEEPLLVWATVRRDDGERGMALVFDEPHPLVAEQLEKVVAGLPAVESLHDDEASAMGSVVSRILDD